MQPSHVPDVPPYMGKSRLPRSGWMEKARNEASGTAVMTSPGSARASSLGDSGVFMSRG